MSSKTAEFDLGNFSKEEELDKLERSLLGAIDAIEKEGWTDQGWTNYDNQQLCIMNAVNVGHTGHKTTSGSRIPKKLVSLVHRAVFPDAELKKYGEERATDKGEMLNELIDWNDGGGAGSKKQVVGALKRALRIHRKEKK